MCHAEMTTVTLSPMKDLEMKCPQKFTTANYVKGDAFQRLFVRRQSNCTAVPEIKEFVNFLPNLTQPQRLRGRFNHRCSCYRALGCGFFVPVFPFQRRSILTARDGFFSEANEASIKFSRKFQRSSHSGEKEPLLEFIAFSNCFHGRTMGPLALTSKEHYRTPFEPVIPGVNFLEYENVQAALDMIHSGKIAAVFVEPIQGESNIYSATKEFLQAL